MYILLQRQLKQAREGVSHGGLGLLSRHRRRQRLKAMLDIMKTLKTLVCLSPFYYTMLCMYIYRGVHIYLHYSKELMHA